MRFQTILAASLATLACFVSALPGSQTLKSLDKAARACAPLSSPTAPYTIVASRPNSPIHYLPFNAGPDYRLVLGGDPDSTPCPLDNQNLCPPGAYTVFAEFGSLYVAVPGGQQVWAGVNGHLGFTAPHSAAYPTGAILDPFTYDKVDQCNSDHGTVATTAFGATSFMACPTIADTSNPDNQWRVFVDFSDAHPPTGNRDDCLGFQALAFDYEDVGNYKAAAWSYT